MISMQQSLLAGIRASGGYFFSTFLFGLMFGIAASSAGLQQWQAMFMSASVFSASAQFASLEFWQAPLPLGTIALSVFLVSTRNILLGISMAHHFDGHSVGKRVVCLFILNDPGVVTSFQLDKSIDRLGYVTGYGLALMLSWLISTLSGFFLATYFAAYDFLTMQFAGPMVMATMMILFIKGSSTSSMPWLVSGAVALLLFEINAPAYIILPGAVVCGAVAGLICIKPENE